ncbi:bifunctional lytic transglycosylase/C40 family peptidase [Frankia sp. ACN1ag]|uniref:C40 family peptidase n=1 Tax=Frankia sp. ACN1ag TaxID=102891 RepID=UPI0006DC1C7A|nr:bifunctional lytic transglycosylase/C40 family peptidase [Frankia sp. ACN1ag]KQC37909.1 hypothetical protein UK82_13025 [Frankia sp. ACN1ag]
MKALAAAGAVLFGLVLLLAAAAAGVLSLADLDGGDLPSQAAADDIPADYQQLYRAAAATCPGLPWTVLAAVGKEETDHGRNPDWTSDAGAQGPMQFLPATFAAYAVDADGGGPDINDPADAIFTAATYLCASGASGGRDIHGALFAYNPDDAYIARVLSTAEGYTDHTSDDNTGGAGDEVPQSSRAAAVAVDYAIAQLGLPYEWGGDGPAAGDIGFDCSGLTQAATQAAGVRLPRVAQDQYNAGPHLPPDAVLQPGDLLFFGASTTSISHVGIYIGGNQMIDAPNRNAPVRIEDYRWNDYRGATRPIHT